MSTCKPFRQFRKVEGGPAFMDILNAHVAVCVARDTLPATLSYATQHDDLTTAAEILAQLMDDRVIRR